MDANQILAIGVVVTAFTGLVTAVLSYLSRNDVKEVQGQVTAVKSVVEESHVMINSQREEMVARIEQLSKTLRVADVDVPPVQAKKT
jgi:hypothetical protein